MRFDNLYDILSGVDSKTWRRLKYNSKKIEPLVEQLQSKLKAVGQCSVCLNFRWTAQCLGAATNVDYILLLFMEYEVTAIT